MSQRSKRGHASSSQETSKKSNNSPENSQTAQSQNSTPTIEHVNKFVRFILAKMGSNVPFKRTDIVQHVFQEKPGKNYDVVLKKATSVLKEVYGLKLEIIDSEHSNKKYFVSNGLPYGNLTESKNIQNLDMKAIITFLTLTHIFMSKNNASDISLWHFLEVFDFNLEVEHYELGNMSVKSFVTKTLVKQNYIIAENRGGELDTGEPKKKFKWGPHAEECVSKMEILKFVSSLYDSNNPEMWSQQFEDAESQFQGCDEANAQIESDGSEEEENDEE